MLLWQIKKEIDVLVHFPHTSDIGQLRSLYITPVNGFVAVLAVQMYRKIYKF